MKTQLTKWFGKKKESKETTGTTNDVLLVKGDFLPAEAADVLLSLLNDKIKFHTVRLLNRRHDDTIEDPLNSQRRIVELKEAKNTITDLVVSARNKGQRLRIFSTIGIESID